MTKRINIAEGIYLVDFGDTVWAVAGGDAQTVSDLLTDSHAHCFAEMCRVYKSQGSAVTGWWGTGDVQFGRTKREAMQQMRQLAAKEGSRYL